MTATGPDFQKMFESLPSQYIVVDPSRIVVAVTESFLTATEKVREKVLGQDILTVFPDNPENPEAKGTQILRQSIERVLGSGKIDILPPVRYDMLQPGGGFKVKYWQPLNAPVLDDGGEVIYVLHGAEDITEQMTAADKD